MDLSILSTRDVMGMYYARLENPDSNYWVEQVSNLFTTDQETEKYPFLGQVARMRKWDGERKARALRDNTVTLTNEEYEVTMEIALKDLRRDKTGQIIARVSEFTDEEQVHWGTLLTSLIQDGTSKTCYDGQFFFDTDHSEDDSGTQDNDITVDISALPAAVHGTTTAPSVEEMQQAIMKGIAQVLSFKDDKGRPMNSMGKRFLVMVPVGLYIQAVAAVSTLMTAALQQNLNPNMVTGLTVEIAMNPELTWTDSFSVWRTDSAIRGLIRQSEFVSGLKVKDENSEFAFDNKAIQIGVDASRAVTYGYWQRACYVTLI